MLPNYCLNLKETKVLNLTLILFLILTTISFAATSNSSRTVIELVRPVALTGSLILIFIVIFGRKGFTLRSIFSVLFYILLVTYGVFLSILNEGLIHIVSQLYINIGVTLLGILIFSSKNTAVISQKTSFYFLAYAMLLLIITIFLDGLTLTYPPRFIFDYTIFNRSSEVIYSQGISKFYGFAAITAIFLSISTKKNLQRYLYLIVCLFFLFLSLLGGGRGDSIAAIFVVLSYAIFKAPKQFILLSGLLIIFGGFILNEFKLDDFVIFNRLIALADNMGMRDILFQQSLSLIIDEPICLIVGCGFGFFQTYYGYGAGLYPHNILIEATIIWGLPIVTMTLILTYGGIRKYLKDYRYTSDAFILLFAFFLFISLKSGTILGAWYVMAATSYFSAIKIGSLTKTKSLQTVGRFDSS